MAPLWALFSGEWGAAAWLYFLAEVSLKAGLLLLVFLLLLRVFGPRRHSVRHAIRSGVLLAVLLLPLGTLLLPRLHLPLIDRPTAVPIVVEGIAADPGFVAARGTGTPLRWIPVSSWRQDSAEAGISHPSEVRQEVVPSWANTLLIAWGAGVCFWLIRLMFGVISVLWTVRSSRPVLDSRWLRLSALASRKLGLTRRVELRQSPTLEVALSVGLFRPVVLLPKVAETWSDSRRESILLHEFAHVKRWDNITNLVAQIACALYWFNPLVWLMARALKVEREKACDDAVLETGTLPSVYAGHLLEVARAVSHRRLWGALEVSQASALKDRLASVLSPAPDGKRGFSVQPALIPIAAVFLAPFAVVLPWASSSAGSVHHGVSHRAALDESVFRRSSSQFADPTSPLLGGGVQPQFHPERPPRRAIQDTEEGAVSEPRSELQPRHELAGRGVVIATGRPGRILAPGIPGFDYQLGLRRNSAGNVLALNRAEPPQSYSRSFPRGGGARHEPSEGGESPATPILQAEIVAVDLGTLGQESAATDINDRGLIVGESRTLAGVVHPFLWSRSDGLVDLGSPASVHTRAVTVNERGMVLCETFNTYLFSGYVWTEDSGMVELGYLSGDRRLRLTLPKAMNEQGHVVGGSRRSNGQLGAFFWSEETGMIDLQTPSFGEALGVNNHGMAVGYANNRAFIWTERTGVHMIGPENASFSAATAVNDRGEVVGYAEYGGSSQRAFYWSQGDGLVDLGRLSEEYPFSFAYEINEFGQVVGQALSDGDDQQRVHSFRWTRDVGMTDLGESTADSRIAINALGQIVGTNRGVGDASNAFAFLWTATGALDLEPEAEPDRLASEAVDLNNSGQIVGSRILSNSLKRAHLWEIVIRSDASSDAQAEKQ